MARRPGGSAACGTAPPGPPAPSSAAIRDGGAAVPTDTSSPGSRDSSRSSSAFPRRSPLPRPARGGRGRSCPCPAGSRSSPPAAAPAAPGPRWAGRSRTRRELVLAGQQRPRRVLAGLDPPLQLRDDLRVFGWRVFKGHGASLGLSSAQLVYPSRLARDQPGCHASCPSVPSGDSGLPSPSCPRSAREARPSWPAPLPDIPRSRHVTRMLVTPAATAPGSQRGHGATRRPAGS